MVQREYSTPVYTCPFCKPPFFGPIPVSVVLGGAIRTRIGPEFSLVVASWYMKLVDFTLQGVPATPLDKGFTVIMVLCLIAPPIELSPMVPSYKPHRYANSQTGSTPAEQRTNLCAAKLCKKISV